MVTAGSPGKPIVWETQSGVVLDGQRKAGTTGIKTNGAYNTLKGFTIQFFPVGISSDDDLEPFSRDAKGYPNNRELCSPATGPSCCRPRDRPRRPGGAAE